MTGRAAAIVERARALIGVRFRPQGRSIEHGLDCIGVIIMATGIPKARARHDYDLRFSDPKEVHRNFIACGMLRIPLDMTEEGDILLVRAGGRQLHVLLLTDLGYLHADAALRRVVEVPGSVPWPILSAWRCPDDGVVAVRMA